MVRDSQESMGSGHTVDSAPGGPDPQDGIRMLPIERGRPSPAVSTGGQTNHLNRHIPYDESLLARFLAIKGCILRVCLRNRLPVWSVIVEVENRRVTGYALARAKLPVRLRDRLGLEPAPEQLVERLRPRRELRDALPPLKNHVPGLEPAHVDRL